MTEQTATQNSGEFSRALVYLRRLWLRLLGIREMPMLVLEQESAMPPVLVLEPPPVSAPTPDPLPDLPPEPARPRRARQTARLKKDVLDQLEAYQVYIKRLRRWHPEAYTIYRRLGAFLCHPDAMVAAMQLEPELIRTTCLLLHRSPRLAAAAPEAQKRAACTGVASNLCFDLLTGQSSGRGVRHPMMVLYRYTAVSTRLRRSVARTTLPADATMLFDGGNMLIALRRPTRTRDRCGPRWNDDVSLRMSIRHSVVDSLTIICAVGYHRRDPRCDLIKKTHYFRYVADIVLRQFNGDDFMRFGIDAEMQFAPTPRGTNTTLLIQPLALAIDLQTEYLSMRRWSGSSRPIDLGRMV